MILNAISINVLGKQKPRKWMQQSQGLGIFCDIINDELDTASKNYLGQRLLLLNLLSHGQFLDVRNWHQH